MSKFSRLAIALLAVIAVALAFGGGFAFGKLNPAVTLAGPGVIAEAWDIIQNNFVERQAINTTNMTRAAIEGMVEALNDPYSSYIGAEYYQIGVSSFQGEFSGIGAQITTEDGKLTVIAPIADSPAEKAGIRAGDVILEVDGEAVEKMTLAEAIMKIRGPEGTTVRLLVLHEGETEPVVIAVVRARIELASVRFEMKEDIACIKITQFSERTGEELRYVLQEPAMAGARGIILDLRGNPGGLLNTVVEVASHFLHDGIAVKVRDSQGNITALPVIPAEPVTDLPTVVLVDDTSASGSEVLSGALQDHRRALISGNTTFGKGSVDVLFPLSDGSGLYLTVSRWLTPDGRLIEGEGIEPDIKLEFTGDDAVQWAIDYLHANR